MAPSRRLLLALALLVAVDAQRGSPFRCRDRDPTCASWAGRGECSSNHDFMAESCPQACDYCENADLMPTPSPFQLDLVCKGDQLAINPLTYKGGDADDLPADCAFRCRDNMTAAICSQAAAEGLCEDKAVAKVVRFQCPESCGVCKALEMAPASAYPKGACREDDETGNAAEHAADCAGWAAAGECVKNFGFMSVSCEAACGLCEVGGATPRTPAQINAPPPPPRRPKAAKKKKRKKASAAASGEAPAEAPAEEAPAAAQEEAAPAAESAAPVSEKTSAPAETAAAEEGEGAPIQGKKKKGWAARAAEKVGAALGKKKAAPTKDET